MEHWDVIEAARFAPEKMRKVNLCETENFFCDVYGLEPGQEQKPHAHEGADKVYYVLEGRGEFTVGEETLALGPLQLVFARAGAPHGVRNAGPERLTVLVFMAPHPDRK
jgi:mannose-6-phosphate isomerase-like protein (cupin superfamily)